MIDTNTKDAIIRLEERMTEVEFKAGLLQEIAFQSNPTRDSLPRWALNFDLTKAKFESVLETLKNLDADRRNGQVIDYVQFERAMNGPMSSTNPHQQCNFLVHALQSVGAYTELIEPFVRSKWYEKFESRDRDE